MQPMTTPAPARDAAGKWRGELAGEPLADQATGLLGALPDAAWLVDLADLRVVALNPAAEALLGQPRAALLGRRADRMAASPEDMAYWAAAAAGEIGTLQSETVIVLGEGGGADGTGASARVLHGWRSIRPVAGVDGTARHALVVVQDRSEAQRLDEEREGRLGELQATLESTADGLLVTDLNGRVRACNRRFAELWSLPEDLLQQHDDAAIEGWMRRSVVDADAYASRLRTLREAPLLAATDRLTLLGGQVMERVTRPLWRNGRPQGRVWCFRDLSERIAAQQRIETLERGDALTGLPNRRRFTEEVEAALQALRRDARRFALLVIDLDRFRQVNDSLGHEVGDRVLQDCAQRIAACLREDDLLARVGGDQFALLLTAADVPAAEATARRVLNAVAQPSTVHGAPFVLTCSIGIALAPAHGRTADDLMRHAEAAMRMVKLSGRAQLRVHQVRVEVDRRSHMRLDHAMRQALVSGRFRLHYQPQVRLADSQLVGAEALLRWRDPELGEVPPSNFVPVAEESGFIVAIGDWVLSQAVRQVALWHQRGHAMPVAVNVSALQFQQSHFVDRLASVLAVSGIPPNLLELELTESILVHDAEETLARLQAISRLGVRMSIDDFGTGYSSLAYLHRFPIDKLKIDRSFMHGLPKDERNVGIVRAILQMARALDMKVLAEGVETESQREFLQTEGCDEFQGWLFAPALDPLSIESRFAKRAPPHTAGPRIRLVAG
jgi:diguanylate cyclase (GGDEF)-like protein